jgi:large subunit ribosomal protein L24
MQKVIRRTVLAEAQAARRLGRRKDRFDREKAKLKRESVNFRDRNESADIKTARKTRREDWDLGPLAPRRDVGRYKDTYGTLDPMRIRGEVLTLQERLQVNPEGGRYANIVMDDRVVLLEGRDKGKIGKVIEVDSQRQEITVERLNLIDVAVPDWMMKAEPGTGAIRTLPKPVPISSVKLVFPLNDPETGTTRDVIVSKIVNGNIFHDRHTGRKRWTRLIAGTDIVIPWPRKEPKQHQDHDCDTLRMEVETRTFVPTLLKPPMPSTVIDELRNKFSIFRVRHDEEYLQAKAEEDAEKEARLRSAKEMMTPMKERNLSAKRALKAKGKPKLSPEMLARIGEAMAKRRGFTVESSPEVAA